MCRTLLYYVHVRGAQRGRRIVEGESARGVLETVANCHNVSSQLQLLYCDSRVLLARSVQLYAVSSVCEAMCACALSAVADRAAQRGRDARSHSIA